MKASVTAVFVVFIACGVAVAQDTYTGCLNRGGSIIKVAIGTAPLSPCQGNQQQISWNAIGPQGEQGEPGETGPEGPEGPQGPAPPRFELMGFSEGLATGDQGALVFTGFCQADFPGSRFCTSEEVMNTVNLPLLPPATAWVRPTFVPSATGLSSDLGTDISGQKGDPQSELSCNGWIFAISADGLVVDSLGGFATDTCETARSIACCAPVEDDG